jgi:hypothetical protein
MIPFWIVPMTPRADDADQTLSLARFDKISLSHLTQNPCSSLLLNQRPRGMLLLAWWCYAVVACASSQSAHGCPELLISLKSNIDCEAHAFVSGGKTACRSYLMRYQVSRTAVATSISAMKISSARTKVAIAPWSCCTDES